MPICMPITPSTQREQDSEFLEGWPDHLQSSIFRMLFAIVEPLTIAHSALRRTGQNRLQGGAEEVLLV